MILVRNSTNLKILIKMYLLNTVSGGRSISQSGIQISSQPLVYGCSDMFRLIMDLMHWVIHLL